MCWLVGEKSSFGGGVLRGVCRPRQLRPCARLLPALSLLVDKNKSLRSSGSNCSLACCPHGPISLPFPGESGNSTSTYSMFGSKERDALKTIKQENGRVTGWGGEAFWKGP